MDNIERGNRKVLQGVVKSDKMDKTIVVDVTRLIKHALYKKYVHRVKSYKAHDANNECRMGDTVQIVESRPYSKEKRWRLKAIVVRSQQ